MMKGIEKFDMRKFDNRGNIDNICLLFSCLIFHVLGYWRGADAADSGRIFAMQSGGRGFTSMGNHFPYISEKQIVHP